MSVKTGKNVPCKKCGKETYRSPKYLKRNKLGFFCSKKCFNIYFWKDNNPIKNREIANKMRMTKISQHRIGPLSHSWRGGIRPLLDQIRDLFEYQQWRSGVYRRDRFKCTGCGNKKSGKLQGHHKEPLSYLVYKYKIQTLEDARRCTKLWDLNNGQTLCDDCHEKTDTYGGRAVQINKRHLMLIHKPGMQDA